jgi:lipid II:glycine glycyltransferase (peptidoglycan interpeptide bridge formation enzyme)
MRHPISSGSGWNERLAKAGGHLLQSWEWGEFKQRHGWTPHRILVEGEHGTAMAQVLYRARGPVSMGYIPRGPVVQGEAQLLWPDLLAELGQSARNRRALMTLIEPNTPLGLTGTMRAAGVTRWPGHVQPSRTVKVPLADDDAILKQMHQKTRYNVRLAQRRGVVVERAGREGIGEFYRLMQDTAERNEFEIHSRAYYDDFLATFGDRAIMLFARVDDGALAAVLIAARFGAEAIYMYGASSTQHRAHGAAFLLQYDAMRWGRDHGCDTYDLWGIPEDDPEPSTDDGQTGAGGTRGDDWRGLYRFKTGFGGQIVTYPPMLERRHVPLVPWLVRRLNLIQV